MSGVGVAPGRVTRPVASTAGAGLLVSTGFLAGHFPPVGPAVALVFAVTQGLAALGSP